MIYPRLNKVGDGQRMSVELVNGLIKRTEYATELLRQYKTIAGDDITIIQQPDGRRISGATRSQLDDLLDGRVPMSELDGYIFDAADIENRYGENARLWIQYSVGGTIIGAPQFAVFPVPGYQAIVVIVLGSEQPFPPINYSFINPPPYNQLGLTTSVQFIEVNFGSSTSLEFKIGTERVNPFL